MLEFESISECNCTYFISQYMFLNSPYALQMHRYTIQRKTFAIMAIMATDFVHTTSTETVNNRYGGLI